MNGVDLMKKSILISFLFISLIALGCTQASESSNNLKKTFLSPLRTLQIPTDNINNKEKCTMPKNNMVIKQNTVFCTGIYNLPDGISIGNSNIELDCNNSILKGNNINTGIYIKNKENIIIRNCNITNYNKGIYSSSSSNTHIIKNNNKGIILGATNNNIIRDNTIKYNKIYGIETTGYENTIISNKITNNPINIMLSSSSSNLITRNSIENSNYGLYFNARSEDNTIWENAFAYNNISAYETINSKNNKYNKSTMGNAWNDFESNAGYPDYYIIQGNGTGVDYHPSKYLKCGDVIIQDTVMYNDPIHNCDNHALLIGADNITLDCNGHTIDDRGNHDFFASDSQQIPKEPTISYESGVSLNNKHGVTVKNCNTIGFYAGIRLYNESSNNLITNNTVLKAGDSGIEINGNNNTILNNTIKDIYIRGMIIDGENNTVKGNIVMNSNWGIGVGEKYNAIKDNIIFNNGFGIEISTSEHNLIINNQIFNNTGWGIMAKSRSNNNTIQDNNITDNDAGVVCMYNCKDNIINNNTISSNGMGLAIAYSLKNIIKNNIFIENIYVGVLMQAGSNYNTLFGNKFINNNQSAREYNNHNKWNNSEIGNYWGDFTNNTGYPDYYEVYGPGSGIDYKPIWDFDNDGYYNWQDCNDNNPDVNPGQEEVCYNNIDDNCNNKIDEGCKRTKNKIMI